jgi:hypothetical protein
MSGRDRGSETWPPLAQFPGDNLELGNAPEEDDVDHHGEPPSWVPGTTAVGTGAGPPNYDEPDDGQLNGGHMYAAGPEDNDAPGFADIQGAGHEFGEDGTPDFQAGPAQAGPHDAQPGPDGMGYGDVSGQAQDFGGGAPEVPDFAAPPMTFGEAHPDSPGAGQGDGGGYGDGTGFSAGPGFEDAPAFTGGSDGPPFQGAHSGYAPQGQQGFEGPGEPAHQGFTDSQPDSYDGPFTGQFRGDYVAGGGGGFGDAPQDGGFGGGAQDGGYGAAHQEDGALRTSPGMGGAYGPRTYQAAENGSRAQDQSFTSNYPPVEPPRSAQARISGMTASLRARRPRSTRKGKKRDQAGRQAQLTVSRVEPWSVMKFSFVISLVAFIVLFVAVAVLYAVLDGLGVFSSLQHTVANITSSQGSSGFNLMTYISASRVLGYTGLLGAINVVLITALSTVGAVLYNITSDLAGGVEITLKESD